MLTEDYCGFETAKLLKEKGFDEQTVRCYNLKKELCACQCNDNETINSTPNYLIAAPTLQMAMKWLREVHNIDISVVPHSHKEGKPFDYEFAYWNGGEYHTPYNEKHPIYHELFGKTWKKYEEACEAAINFCLEKLI